MKKATLAGAFADLRAERHLPMLNVAKKAGIAETTVWKVENGKPVKWETLHMILTLALGVQPGTDRYQSFHALWLAQRNDLAERRPEGAGKKRLSPHAAKAVSVFREIVRPMDEGEVRKLLSGVKRLARR